MRSNGSRSRTGRRLPWRLVAVLAVALAACAGVAFAGLDADEPDVSPIAGALAEAWGLEPTGAAAGERAPAPWGGVATAAHRVASDLHARMAELSQVRRALAETRRDGGSPIVVVREATALRSEPGGPVIERVDTETEFGSPRVHAVVGREGDWLEVLATELPNGETAWIGAEDVAIGGIGYSLHASLGERTLEVRRDGRMVRRVRIAIGGPSTPTPTGTFAVTDKVRMTAEGSTYGCCALALTGHQPHVPQGWTGGDRLAIHGTQDESTVGQAVSLGCFRAVDADMHWLVERVPLGTPITIEP